jgi:aminoglycoside phosphotransferase (APT) family kinase protein
MTKIEMKTRPISHAEDTALRIAAGDARASPYLATLVARLRREGLLRGGEAVEIAELPGGISSELHLVRQGDRSLVVKRALEKLRALDDWHSDPARNRYEQRYLRYVTGFLPGAVPRVLFGGEDDGYFGMEYLGDGFASWKTALLAGEFDPRTAGAVMALLGRIHAESRGRPEIARDFDTTAIFRQLRTDPYLRTTGGRHPALRTLFEAEALRLEGARECLVHGDFSPKNVLVGPGRTVVLDCEAAWYGDPAFDIAFLLNHICLKTLLHAPADPGFAPLFASAVDGYFSAAGMPAAAAADLDRRSARLLPMLMLARVDGKSPAEYLTDERKKRLVREWVAEILPRFNGTLAEFSVLWADRLRRSFPPA